MKGTLFAVIRTRGARWNEAQPMEGQEDWLAHASYMNALVSEGFMLLGGPMLDTSDVLLIVRARDQAAVEARLAADCWSVNDLLRTRQISPWWLRLGSLGDP